MRRFAAIPALLAALLLVAGATARAQSPAALRAAIEARYPDVAWVDGDRLARWMADGGRRTVLLDARTREEYDVSHLRGAVWVHPEATDPAALDIPRDVRLVVYCSVGWRSGRLADRFREAGFDHVYNLAGGIFQWANEGRPVYRQGERVREVHPYDASWGRLLDEELRSR